MKSIKLQSAIDYLVSYGIVIIVLSTSMYIIVRLGVFNYQLTPNFCYTSPGFSCISYSINSTGDLSLVISQSLGNAIKVNGAACSTQINSTADAPVSGNVNLLPYNNVPAYYPNNALKNGISMPSDSLAEIQVGCYSSSNTIASGALGSSFTGYVWLNYTFASLPGSTVHRIASVSIRYT